MSITESLLQQTGSGLEWNNINYKIKTGKNEERVLLDDISGYVRPGEMVALMGSSGAGKTTLLNSLAGRLTSGDLKGEVLYQGQKRHPSTFKRQMAYVEQNDLLYPYFTVEETIHYATLLRLAKTDYPTEEAKWKRTQQVIDLLQLRKAAKTQIGNDLVRGVSGGEKKRVSIGVELVTNPDVLFLDEPTSGLDSTSALQICKVIKEITQEDQKVTLMTIHQPSAKIFNSFDKLILLVQGKLVYFGKISEVLNYFSELGYDCSERDNPADYLLDLITVSSDPDEAATDQKRIDSLIEHYRLTQQQEKMETGSETTPPKQNPPSVNSLVNKPHLNWFSEFWILFKRSWLDAIRNRSRIFANFGQAIFLMLLFGFVFFRQDLSQPSIQNRIGLLFFVPVNSSFGVIMPLLGIFTLERAIMVRERASKTYRVSSFYLSKALTEIPINLVFNAIFLTGVYLLANLRLTAEAFFTYLGIIAALIVCTTSIGLAIGAVFESVQVAQIIAPLFIGIFLIFGGNLVNNENVPAVLSWIRYTSYINYSYQALMQNEFKGLNFECPPDLAGCIETGEQVLERFSVNEIPLELCIVYVLVIAVVFLLGGYVLLRQRSKLRGIWI